jgi:hypothetical protein
VVVAVTSYAADRRKHWLACEDHREQLSAFLSTRGFLREAQPLADEVG